MMYVKRGFGEGSELSVLSLLFNRNVDTDKMLQIVVGRQGDQLLSNEAGEITRCTVELFVWNVPWMLRVPAGSRHPVCADVLLLRLGSAYKSKKACELLCCFGTRWQVFAYLL
jgi:hypothetical protein